MISSKKMSRIMGYSNEEMSKAVDKLTENDAKAFLKILISFRKSGINLDDVEHQTDKLKEYQSFLDTLYQQYKQDK